MNREDLLDFLPKNGIGVEIGVFKGEFSDILLQRTEPKVLYLIDPWIGDIHSGDKDGKNLQYISGDQFYKDVIIPKYDSNHTVKILRDKSSVLNNFDDNFFDWCYIDGDHSYEGAKSDLECMYKKVKPGGIIMGHDYIQPRFSGVVRAVNEFTGNKNLEISHISEDGCPSFFIFNRK
jgi:hypothetical protein